MAYNTVGGVVNRAIELGQLDSSFLVLAREAYNLILNDETTSYDFPYYRTQASDVPLTSKTMALPVDYSRSDTCYLVDQNNNVSPIVIISKYRFDRMVNGSLTGDPTMAYIDLSNRKIVFNSVPSANRTYRLTYFRLPAVVDESGGNDGDTVDFENPLTLVYLIAAYLLDYTDDERAPMIQQKADKMLRDNKLNSYDEDNNSIVELGPNFRSGSRPIRGGGMGWNF